MIRILNLLVVGALVLAAVFVYKVKFEATVQAERVAKVRVEIRRERDAVASLRADWAQLDNPTRIQALAQRHLPLKPQDPAQVDQIERLPERPVETVPADDGDPIGAMIENPDFEFSTGTITLPDDPK